MSYIWSPGTTFIVVLAIYLTRRTHLQAKQCLIVDVSTYGGKIFTQSLSYHYEGIIDAFGRRCRAYLDLSKLPSQ